MIDRSRTWHRADIEEDAYIGLQDRAEGIEEPAVRIDFLLVLLFKAENDLDRDDSLFCTFDFH